MSIKLQNIVSLLKGFETELERGYQSPTSANLIVEKINEIKHDSKYIRHLDEDSRIYLDKLYNRYGKIKFHLVEPGSEEESFIKLDERELG
jgi:hypothetical protein